MSRKTQKKAGVERILFRSGLIIGFITEVLFCFPGDL